MSIKAGDSVRRIRSANGPGAKVGQLAKVVRAHDYCVEVKYPGNLKETSDGCEIWLITFTELVPPTGVPA